MVCVTLKVCCHLAQSGERVCTLQKSPLSLLPISFVHIPKWGVVLDNTIGSGTTAIAAMREGRHFVGFELNEEYFGKAVERIEREREAMAAVIQQQVDNEGQYITI